ncbi:MAG: flagellar biosynthetic protein FliR [Fimbriimonadaceae bacterium]
MNLDSLTIWSGALLFARTSALLLALPMLSNLVPPMIRVFTAVILTWALLPVFPGPSEVPPDLASLLLGVLGAVGFGLLTALSIQAVVWAFQAAGNVIDLQIGTGSAQLLNPALGSVSAPLGQFHAILASVLVFVTDGHHLVIRGLSAIPRIDGIPGAMDVVMLTIQTATVAAVQIAAPVISATILIDIASALVARAVPQAQPYFLALPAKLVVGLGIVAVGLPALAIAAKVLVTNLTIW